MDDQSVHQLARDVFGDPEKAERWLRQPLSILDGRTALEIAESPDGEEMILAILAKIDWGAAA